MLSWLTVSVLLGGAHCFCRGERGLLGACLACMLRQVARGAVLSATWMAWGTANMGA